MQYTKKNTRYRKLIKNEKKRYIISIYFFLFIFLTKKNNEKKIRNLKIKESLRNLFLYDVI